MANAKGSSSLAVHLAARYCDASQLGTTLVVARVLLVV
jgi:hypothetical protein